MGVKGAAPGDVIDKYRVEREIAYGGMSVVVAARHTTLDRTVAIKLLVRPEGLLAQEAATRFTREARAAASIESDHVCRVFDVGMLGTTPYMVMEYLEGVDLETELELRGRLPADEAVELISQALRGLAVAHDLGIVHRDLKPANLFLENRPDGRRRVKLLDFGISKVEGRDASLTDTKGSFGTPLYMSPEQVKNAKNTDLRTDIWAIGAILYELISGQPPFTGETSGEVLAAVLEERHAPLLSVVPSVDQGLSAVIEKCLTRDRNKRFADARELASALAPFGRPSIDGDVPSAKGSQPPSRPSPTSVRTLAASLADSAAASNVRGHGRTAASRSRARRALGIASGVLLLIAIMAGVISARARRVESVAAVPTSLASAAASTPSIAVAAMSSEPAVAPVVAPTSSGAVERPKGSPPRASAPSKPKAASAASRSTAAKVDPSKSAADILKDSY